MVWNESNSINAYPYPLVCPPPNKAVRFCAGRSFCRCCVGASRNGYRSLSALMDAARADRVEDPILYNTLCRLGSRKAEEALQWVWSLEGEPLDLGAEPDVDRIAKLKAVAENGTCTCGGSWALAAEWLLALQHIDSQEFRSLVLRALRNGRAKDHNILICGEPDGGKSFVLKPFSRIFDAFVTRGQNERFPLQGLHHKEICLLQDVRYDSFGLSWDDWLRWGEGEDMMVKLPRCSFEASVPYKGTAPLFATMADLFSFPIAEARRAGRLVERENVQWRSRWRVIMFRLPIPREQRNSTLKPCCKCCAEWYLAADAVVEDAYGAAAGDDESDDGIDWSVAPVLLAAPQRSVGSKRPRLASEGSDDDMNFDELAMGLSAALG